MTDFPSYPASAEPVAMWQWRYFIAGRWGGWLPVDDVDKLRNGDWKFNFDNGTAELRPLYAAPQPLSVDAQGSGDCVPVEEWPKEIDESVLIYVVHHHAQYEPDQERRRAEWEGWFVGHWTDFNNGGWVWHGMLGTVTHVAPLPGSPAVSSTARGTPERWEDRRVDETGPEYEARTGKLVTGTPLTSPNGNTP